MVADILAQAREIRAAMDAAGAVLTDEQASGCTELFPAWSGAQVAYPVGGRVKFAGLLYCCSIAHNSQPDWQPTMAASLWARVDDPATEWPQWRQPQGAHDAYALGAKVSHQGGRYVSNVGGNVWQPPEQWTKQN